MAQFLKQSTACTIMFGVFVDKADGITLKTDATTITDIDHATTGIFLSKAGAAAAIRSQAVTASVADAYGMMKVTLSTTDTGTLGTLDVLFAKAATYLPVHKSFMVLPANIFDSLVSGTDLVDVSVTQLGGVAQSATDLKDFADDGYDPSTNKVQGLVLADAVTGMPTAATIASAVWDLDATTHQTQGTFGQAIGDPAADAHTIYDAVVTAAAGVNVAADIIALKAETALIVADTNELQTDWVNGGRLDLILDTAAVASPSAATIAAAVWDLDATGHTTQGTFGQAIGDPVADTNSIFKAVVTDATAATVGLDVVDLKTQIGTAGAGLTAADDAVIAAIGALVSPPSAATVAAAVWDLDATTHQTQGTFGQAIGDPAADAHTIYGAVVTDAAGVNIAADIIAVKAETALIVADTNELQTDWTNGGRLDLILDTAAAISPPSAATIADAVWNEASGDHVGAGSTGLALASASAPTAAAVADAVWDGAMADHLDVGSTGAALSAAGAAGDPWITPIPGAYIAGQAGYVVGTTIAGDIVKVPKSDGSLTFNATCSSDIKSGLSTQAELNKVPKSDGTTTWNATALGDIQTQAEDALVVHRLDELLNADSDIDGASPPTIGSVFHELLTKAAGSFTYDQATDSLEALRDRGDTAWITATGFSTFDPTTDPVLLADGVHGGVNATFAAKSISVINSANNGVAVNIQGTGTGNSHGINLSSANGKALAIGAVGNAVTIDSSAAAGLVVNGVTGDIVADITGAVSSVGNIADAVWDEAVGDHAGAGSTGLALAGATAPSAATVADAVWNEASGDHIGAGSTGLALANATPVSAGTIADAVWNEASGDHVGVGSTGKVLADTLAAASAITVDGDAIADALLDRDLSTGVDTGTATKRTVRQALRFLRNKWSIAGTTITITREDDVTKSWEGELGTTAGANPVTSSDPES